MSARLFLGGLKSYLPMGIGRYRGTGGSTSGRYCYSVWLRHLEWIGRAVGGFAPRRVVEVGPGDSIGVGLAALLSGADEYTGLDVVAHASPETNARVLEDLLVLFRERAPIPGDDEFPRLVPRLVDPAFPAARLDGAVLDARVAGPYAHRLRAIVREPGSSGGPVRYHCPWTRDSVAAGTADLVISHVALQDMDSAPSGDALETAVAAMAGWLAPGGVMSHQIDFSCPGGSPWNHHWRYGDAAWRLIRGRRPYYVNRAALSDYLALFERAGCRVAGVEPVRAPGLGRDRVAKRFRGRTDEDFETAAALIVAVRE